MTRTTHDSTTTDPEQSALPSPASAEAVPDDHTQVAYAPPDTPEHKSAGNQEGTKQKIGRIGTQIVVLVVTIVAATLVTWFLISQKTAPGKTPVGRETAAVEAFEVRIGRLDVVVSGYGTVRAARRLQIAPQVGGRVVEIHPQLRTGGFIPGGAVALRIDPTDYELALQRARADLSAAQASLSRVDAQEEQARATLAARRTTLQTIQAEADVALEEFRQLNPEAEEVPPLVGRRPQLEEAQAQLAAAEASLQDVEAQRAERRAAIEQAQAALDQAQINLERTSVEVPSYAERWRVISETVDVGQVVTANQSVAEVYDADRLEVAIPLRDSELQWFDVGSAEAEASGSPAMLIANFAGGLRQWPATVDRTEGEIDPQTRLIDVILLATPSDGLGPDRLVPGLFVEARINGRDLQNVTAIPRRALRRREGSQDQVYVVHSDALAIRDVEIVRLTQDTAIVRGLANGEQVILTRLAVVDEGLPVNVRRLVGPNGEERPATQPAQAEADATSRLRPQAGSGEATMPGRRTDPLPHGRSS